MLYFEEWRKGNKNSIKIFLVVLPDWVVVSWMKTFFCKDVHMDSVWYCCQCRGTWRRRKNVLKIIHNKCNYSMMVYFNKIRLLCLQFRRTFKDFWSLWMVDFLYSNLSMTKMV